jgi:hypothetical protein
MPITHLQDCGCLIKVYSDDSPPDIEYCNLHWTAPDFYKACLAALAYDKEIEKASSMGKSWVASSRLDRLYADWISKAESAIEKFKGKEVRNDYHRS